MLSRRTSKICPYQFDISISKPKTVGTLRNWAISITKVQARAARNCRFSESRAYSDPPSIVTRRKTSRGVRSARHSPAASAHTRGCLNDVTKTLNPAAEFWTVVVERHPVFVQGGTGDDALRHEIEQLAQGLRIAWIAQLATYAIAMVDVVRTTPAFSLPFPATTQPSPLTENDT
jgi:hypothetical protein